MKSALNASYGSRDLQLEKGGEGRETKAVSSRLNQEVTHVRVPTSVQVGLDTLPRAHGKHVGPRQILIRNSAETNAYNAHARQVVGPRWFEQVVSNDQGSCSSPVYSPMSFKS